MSIILNASIVILTHHYYYCTSRFPSLSSKKSRKDFYKIRLLKIPPPTQD